MGILQSKSEGYWAYFLALERDLETLSRYVQFTTENIATYSVEMARILLAAGSEADVLLKAICRRLDPQRDASAINGYFEIVNGSSPNLITFEVLLPRWGIHVRPWETWGKGNPPDWWQSHNKVKHHREEHFQRANLLRTIESVAAVYVLNIYVNPTAAEDGSLIPMPSLFRPAPPHCAGTTFGDFDVGINYVL